MSRCGEKCCGLRGWLSPLGNLTGELSLPMAREVPYYDGPYVVIPKAYEEQNLPTRDKKMRDDVTVTEVQYAEVSNIYGTTVTIAS